MPIKKNTVTLNKAGNVRLQGTVTPELAAQVKNYCYENDVTIGEFLQLVLDDFFENDNKKEW